jgi:hypothetical protein
MFYYVRIEDMIPADHLLRLVDEKALHNLQKNKAMATAVQEHEYSRREVSGHLAMHFTSIGRIMRSDAPRK